MEFENRYDTKPFSQPVKVHGRDPDGSIHGRIELYDALGELFWGLTESKQLHITKRLYEVIESLLTGRRPRNVVDVSGDSGNRQITHLFQCRLNNHEAYAVAFRWEPKQALPLEIISIKWSSQLVIDHGRPNRPLNRRRRYPLEQTEWKFRKF